MRRIFLLITLIALPALPFSPDAMAQANPNPNSKPAAKALFPLLPTGAGRDVMIRVCSQCHTPERAALERHNLDGWNDLIGVMQTNGAEASDEEFDQIAAYLAEAFPPGNALPKKK